MMREAEGHLPLYAVMICFAGTSSGASRHLSTLRCPKIPSGLR